MARGTSMTRGSTDAEPARPRAGAVEDRPVVVVSNRLPVTVHRGARGLESRRSPGGLVSALEPVLQRHGGTWVGWPGIELRKGEKLGAAGGAYDIRAVRLTEREINGYYHGFSNRTLWPLCHSFPGRTRFDRREWEVYQHANARFAEATAEVADDVSLVWIHDYHLMLVPQYLGEMTRGTRLAFFLHIPFPPYDLFRLLPWDRDLLRGLLACDLVGFHVAGYARNFLDCAERLLGARVDREAMLVEHGDRTVRVGAFPIGIDFDFFEGRARAAPPAGVGTERVVLGVDRLDYTKGIPERIRAFERLLELHPEHREKVVLMQIAVPSRFQVAEYRELKREIDELVGRVNGRFATSSWSPIRYLYRSFPQDRLAALYRDADLALVTPLRDGMNLVAKEFVACQVAEPGVLVLSRLAGAAETMREALLVNPYNLDATAEAIHRALTMSEDERRSRLTALRVRERRSNLDVWLQGFLSAALADHAGIRPPTDADFEAWLGTFLGNRRLALFLDYDGTLTPLCEHPMRAVLPEPMRRALEDCVRRPDTTVAVISGRALEDVQRMVGLSGVAYAANHGLEIVGPRIPYFRHEDLVHYELRTAALAGELNALAGDGAWTEQKGATLTFHFRGVEPARQAALAEQARSIITRAGFQARDAHCAVEARPPIGWDKGQAVLHLVRSLCGPSWSESVRVIYVGDDQTDEDAFRVLAGLGVTFRVGSADTATHAARRLPNVDAVQALLEWLGRRPLSTGASRRAR
jgi:trehalose 6-phosphate synthase/phosphatase